MNEMNGANNLVNNEDTYEAPTLVFIGMATDVVLGLPGDTWDGLGGFYEPEFEFLDDAK
jgi:hypothetical protein